MKKKVLRISTVPVSLNLLLKGQLRMLNERYEVVAVSSSGKELEEVGEREGVRTLSVDMERHISPLKDWKALIKLVRVIRQEKPWMVHTLTPKAGLLGMLAAWICRVPVRIHTFTGLLFPTSTGLKRKILMVTDRLTCACANFINPEGEGVKRDLIRFHITGKHLHVIGNGNINGIDMEYFRRSDEVMWLAECIREEHCVTFCFVGRIVKDKGMDELAAAFKLLVKDFPACRLLLVGDFEETLDPVNPETRRIFQSDPRIRWVGWQDDIRPFLAAADVFVFPSYREGFPNVLLQAGAMGLPCIVTDINGSNEIIRNEENGLIISSHDADALRKAMELLVVDEAMRDRMADKARTLIGNRYERQFLWEEIRKTFRRLENRL